MVDFTFTDYEKIFQASKDLGYRSITVSDFFNKNFSEDENILVNRVDVDIKIERVPIIASIFSVLGIKASFYFRLHSPSYNLLSLGNILIVKKLIENGFEVGLHTELVDAQEYCKINSENLLRTELSMFESIFGFKVKGTASHGDMTPFNNLDFWKTERPSTYDLQYEAYDNELWQNCRYVSDSEWIRWKAYENGELLENDRRNPIEHMMDKVKVLQILTHPESWYENYIYE